MQTMRTIKEIVFLITGYKSTTKFAYMQIFSQKILRIYKKNTTFAA